MLDWGANAGKGTKKNCENPIVLKDNYRMNWKVYSEIDETNTGTFLYLINQISG